MNDIDTTRSAPPTVCLPAADLTHEHVLVGESGGLSQVYAASLSSILSGMIAVETEHGFLYLDADPEQTYAVLAQQ